MDEKTFAPRADLIEQEHEATYQPQLITIKALISPGIKDQFIERYGRKCIENYNSEFFLATINVPQNSTGFKFLASFGTNLKIMEPETYVDDFRNYLSHMVEIYTSEGRDWH